MLILYRIQAVVYLFQRQENLVCPVNIPQTIKEGTYTLCISLLLKPIQFHPCYCPLLTVDGIAYGCQQLFSAAPGAGLQGVVEEGQRLQLQLLGLAHLLHYAVLSTAWKKLPISSVGESHAASQKKKCWVLLYICNVIKYHTVCT